MNRTPLLFVVNYKIKKGNQKAAKRTTEAKKVKTSSMVE